MREICRVTNDGLFSVIIKPSRNPFSKAYEKLAEERGYNVRHLGPEERELIDTVKPAKSVRAAYGASNADKYLIHLKQRAYSRQWKVPENVDKWIVQELERRFAGRKHRFELFVLRWSINDLKSKIEGD